MDTDASLARKLESSIGEEKKERKKETTLHVKRRDKTCDPSRVSFIIQERESEREAFRRAEVELRPALISN